MIGAPDIPAAGADPLCSLVEDRRAIDAEHPNGGVPPE